MEHDEVSTDIVTIAKKKIRLSQVVDKLTGLGNGNVLADKENNNIPGEQEEDLNNQVEEPVQLYDNTPQPTTLVSNTHPITQQPVPANLPHFYQHNFPNMLTPPPDNGSKIPSVNLPLFGTTAPDLLSIMPESSSNLLHNFFMYGRHTEIGSQFYRYGPQALNFWQLALNSQRNFGYNQLLNPNIQPTSTVVKPEPDGIDEDAGNMEFDDNYDSKYSPSHEISASKGTINMSSQHINSENAMSLTSSVYQPQQRGVSVRSVPIAPNTPMLPTSIHPVSSTIDKFVNSDTKQSDEEGASRNNYAYGPLPLKINTENVKIEPKVEYNGSTDTESNFSWRGSNPSPHSNCDTNQEFPLDLSIKTLKREGKTKNKSSKRAPREPKRSNSQEGFYPEVRGDVASPTTRETVAARYNMEVSPVVEQMAEGADTAWACPVCGQLFSQKDRLAKHVACRHRGRSPSRTHVCWSCNRGFSRSDMLTRHLRLHTGQKPYQCGVCGQIFSRSDHLATHKRTHTGEKPYKCPQCTYSACRRDMITRHMRTHRSSTSNLPQGNSTPSPIGPTNFTA